MRGSTTKAKTAFLRASLAYAASDGWSERTWHKSVVKAGLTDGEAQMLFPRGTLDLALYFHDYFDQQLDRKLPALMLKQEKIRDRVAAGVRLRLELIAEHREAVRRAISFFALPPYLPHGIAALWRTADIIWKAAGDSSTDYNKYSKRAILLGVYSSTLLYWLDDKSENQELSWQFLKRRIDDALRMGRLKSYLPIDSILRYGQKFSARVCCQKNPSPNKKTKANESSIFAKANLPAPGELVTEK